MAKIREVVCPICGNEGLFAECTSVKICRFCRQRFVMLFDPKIRHYVAKPRYDFTQEEIDELLAKASDRGEQAKRRGKEQREKNGKCKKVRC